MIKSCGPDRDKIITTMQEFGPDYTYVITSYPPFLKGLLDDDRLDWSRYDVVARSAARASARTCATTS